jgi:hypothetical protein
MSGSCYLLVRCPLYSAGFNIVLGCALAQGPHLPAKKPFLRWIFAYVVQFKILKFPEHDCLCRPTESTSFRAKSKGPQNLTGTGPRLS